MRHRYRVVRALCLVACSARRRSCCHRCLRIRETTPRRRCLGVAGVIHSNARRSLGGRLAHRPSSIRRRTPSSHGRLSGWRIYSHMRIRTSLRVISVARDKISSPLGNTSKTKRTEMCAVISIEFLCAPSVFAYDAFTLPCHPSLARFFFIHPLCFVFVPFSHFIFRATRGLMFGMCILCACIITFRTKTQVSYRRIPIIMVYMTIYSRVLAMKNSVRSRVVR